VVISFKHRQGNVLSTSRFTLRLAMLKYLNLFRNMQNFHEIKMLSPPGWPPALPSERGPTASLYPMHLSGSVSFDDRGTFIHVSNAYIPRRGRD
jgi:hypothetical protein